MAVCSNCGGPWTAALRASSTRAVNCRTCSINGNSIRIRSSFWSCVRRERSGSSSMHHSIHTAYYLYNSFRLNSHLFLRSVRGNFPGGWSARGARDRSSACRRAAVYARAVWRQDPSRHWTRCPDSCAPQCLWLQGIHYKDHASKLARAHRSLEEDLGFSLSHRTATFFLVYSRSTVGATRKTVVSAPHLFHITRCPATQRTRRLQRGDLAGT